MHTSVMAGDMDKVKSLVVNGADINARDEDEVSILLVNEMMLAML